MGNTLLNWEIIPKKKKKKEVIQGRLSKISMFSCVTKFGKMVKITNFFYLRQSFFAI